MSQEKLLMGGSLRFQKSNGCGSFGGAFERMTMLAFLRFARVVTAIPPAVMPDSISLALHTKLPRNLKGMMSTQNAVVGNAATCR